VAVHHRPCPRGDRVVLIGGLLILLITLELVRAQVGNLILGGAFTAVLLGIAAQQTLGNLFAGIVLLLARPFAVGDSVRMRAGVLSGQIEGVVADIGITLRPAGYPRGQA
jgi:small-conductance mechanosensitive channel